MKYGEMTFGQAEAVVNRLGGMEGVKALLASDPQKLNLAGVLAGTHKIVPMPLLRLVATFDLPATTTPFVVRDHFRVDTSDTAQVKIAYLSDNFKSWCLTKIEAPVAQMSLRASVLQRNSLDPAIICSLGGGKKVETTFSTVWALMTSQGQGQAGRLLTNGYANIFYVRDVQSVLRAVRVCWYVDGWCVDAYPVENPIEWREGYLVFSRNS